MPLTSFKVSPLEVTTGTNDVVTLTVNSNGIAISSNYLVLLHHLPADSITILAIDISVMRKLTLGGVNVTSGNVIESAAT